MKVTNKFITVATRDSQQLDCKLEVLSAYPLNGTACVGLLLRRANQNRNTRDRYDEEYLKITATADEADELALQLMDLAQQARRLTTT